MKAKSIDAPAYTAAPAAAAPRMSDDEILAAAREISARRYFSPEARPLLNPQLAQDYARFHCSGKKESFHAVFLDAGNVPLAHKKLFTGTLSSCTVYPREFIAAVLKANAANVIIIHNHPSGNPEPSDADKTLTRQLANALQMIDARLIDHLIVGRREVYSFAEHGLI